MAETREQPSSRISAGDPLPLRLCVFASLRHCVFAFSSSRLCVLFFQTAGSLREIHYLCGDLFYLFLVGLFKEFLLS